MSLFSSLAHSWRVIRDALKDDKARRKARLPMGDREFLPAALEVIEQPVSPTARITAWVLIIGLIATIAWLVLGRVDVVASAQGKILPAGAVKIVQSAGSGVVRSVLVKDGDHVKRGQLLVELDTTMATADLQLALKGLLNARIEIARNRAIAGQLAGTSARFVPPAGTPAEVAETQRLLIAAQVGEVEASVASLAAARRSSLAEADAASATLRKLDDTIPILDHELEAMVRLDAKGYAPGNRLLELQRQRRSEAGERDVAYAQQARAHADADKLGQQMAQSREQARRIALADLSKAESEAIQRQEEVTKATRRTGLQQLRAPTDGTVQQLTLHTIGGVVEPARTLMVVVPSRTAIEVEARILNKDIGFIREGQSVAVKIEAFPFTRYGTIPGKVVSISRDAVPDPKMGATYVAQIQLARSTLVVDGKTVLLSSGMGVVADIRTGSRRIISYLLSPVQTSVAQAGRER